MDAVARKLGGIVIQLLGIVSFELPDGVVVKEVEANSPPRSATATASGMAIYPAERPSRHRSRIRARPSGHRTTQIEIGEFHPWSG